MGAPKTPKELQNKYYLMKIDPDDPTKIVQIGLVDTGETNADGLRIMTLDVGSSKGMNVIIVAKTIGQVTFTGSGLDDMSSGGEFTGLEDVSYLIEIDATGSPDTFQWSDDGGATYTTGVSITGLPQTLSNGVTVTFNALLGHTLADVWSFTCRFADPSSVQKTVERIMFVSFVGAGNLTSTEVDLRNTQLIALTVSGDFDAAAVLGMTVEMFSSFDGVNWDTDSFASIGLEPSVTPGVVSQKTSIIDGVPAFVRVKVTNNDALGLGSVTVNLMKLEV